MFAYFGGRHSALVAPLVVLTPSSYLVKRGPTTGLPAMQHASHLGPRTSCPRGGRRQRARVSDRREAPASAITSSGPCCAALGFLLQCVLRILVLPSLPIHFLPPPWTMPSARTIALAHPPTGAPTQRPAHNLISPPSTSYGSGICVCGSLQTCASPCIFARLATLPWSLLERLLVRFRRSLPPCAFLPCHAYLICVFSFSAELMVDLTHPRSSLV